MGWQALRARLEDAIPWSPPVWLGRRAWASDAALRAAAWRRYVPGVDVAACERRWGELAAKYDLGLLRCCGAVEFVEGLYALDLLDRRVGADVGASVGGVGGGLEVGAKYGGMLPGLAAFCPGWVAVERLAHTRYADLRTRRAWGEAYAAALPGCRYVAGDVRGVQKVGEGFGVVAWFLPFLFEEPAAAWGYPAEELAPEGVLRHVLSLLRPGGVALIVNQGEEEHAEQGRLLGRSGAVKEAVDVKSVFAPYRRERFGWRCCIPKG